MVSTWKLMSEHNGSELQRFDRILSFQAADESPPERGGPELGRGLQRRSVVQPAHVQRPAQGQQVTRWKYIIRLNKSFYYIRRALVESRLALSHFC